MDESANRLFNVTGQRSATQDLSVIRAALQYQWLVLALIVACAAGAYYVSSILPTSFVARASILLEDPREQIVFSDAPIASARNIQNQLEVFRSSAVAERAVEISAEDGLDTTLSRLLDRADIINVAGTDLISVSFSGDSEQEALIATTSLLSAYVEVRADQRDEEIARIVDRIDSAQAALRDDLAEVQEQIDTLASEHDFNSQINALLLELTAIESQLATTTGAAQRANLVERQQEIDDRLRTLQLAKEVAAASGEMAELTIQRNALIDRIEALALQRSESEIQSQTTGTGIAFVDAASITTVSEGAGTTFTLGVGAFLGLLIGLGWAYSLSSRRNKFDEGSQPQTVLNLPLLGDIPRIGRHALSSGLPVRDSPESPISEAFRFTALSIEHALARREGKGVVFLSTHAGQGKTLLIANTALAASRRGKKVLVVDADFGNQELTRTLIGDATGVGLTEMVSKGAMLRDVVRKLDLEGFGTVDVLQRGQLSDIAPEFFERERVKSVFRDLMLRYDLVLVDVPPVLQVAYTSTIATLVHHAVVVIRKGANMSSVEDLLRRAKFLDVELLGYIYNAGVSEDPRTVMGSMRNVLGERSGGTTEPRTRSESSG